MRKNGFAMRTLALLLISPMLLTACAKAPSSACPKPKEYSLAEQAKVADALAAESQGSILARFIADYGVLRAESRACAGQ